ncbi:hypothetical protein [Methylomonas sp. MgM2]
MTPMYSYVALIDVLAYRSRLESDKKMGQFKLKDDLEGALSVFDVVSPERFGVQAISDTIILSCDNHNDFLEFLILIKRVFLAFLDKGLFIRGGVSYSKHFHSGRLTYSHAVARAYEIENKIAIYPRIVIDSNIIEMYSSSTSLPAILGKDLFVSHNKVNFLHIIDDQNFDSVYVMAKNIYDRDIEDISLDEGAFSKHQWFEDYIFTFAGDNASKQKYIKEMIVF